LNEDNWADYAFDNLDGKFNDVGTDPDNNVVEVSPSNDLSRSEIEERIIDGIDNNIDIDIYPDKVRFSSVRVVTQDGETIRIDVSEYTND